MQYEIDGLKDENKSLNDKVDDLLDIVENIQANVDALQQVGESNKESIASDISVLSAKVFENKATIAENIDSISDIIADIETNAALIAKMGKIRLKYRIFAIIRCRYIYF